MQSKLLPALTYLLLLESISGLWFFSPQPRSAEDYCGTSVSINAHMGFVVNCDASTYALPAQFPGRLMQKDEVRQLRPLYVLLGTIVGYPISGITRMVSPGLDPRVPFQIGFILLNFIILYATLLLFDAMMCASGIDRLVTMPSPCSW